MGLPGATGIGVGSMLGAGVFVVWAPALAAAGRLVVVAVVVAGAVAAINALSTAQLAARYPGAGGAYAYGRAELGARWGFVAGVAFVAGKTASVAAVALAIGTYAWPAHAAIVATAGIAGSWGLNARGITRTAAVATALGAAVLAGLGAVMVAALRAGPPMHPVARLEAVTPPPRFGVLTAAALIFFAFAGYARVATLGEEVRDPARTIPRAIAVALGAVGALYLLIAVAFRDAWGGSLARAEGVPLRDLAAQVQGGEGVVAVLAPLSAVGALVALTAGIGRTAMAMARGRDLPRVFARRDRAGVPWVAEGRERGAVRRPRLVRRPGLRAGDVGGRGPRLLRAREPRRLAASEGRPEGGVGASRQRSAWWAPSRASRSPRRSP